MKHPGCIPGGSRIPCSDRPSVQYDYRIRDLAIGIAGAPRWRWRTLTATCLSHMLYYSTVYTAVPHQHPQPRCTRRPRTAGTTASTRLHARVEIVHHLRKLRIARFLRVVLGLVYEGGQHLEVLGVIDRLLRIGDHHLEHRGGEERPHSRL